MSATYKGARVLTVNEDELICDEGFFFSLQSKLGVLHACMEGISAQWGFSIGEKWVSNASNMVEALEQELESWLIVKEQRTRRLVSVEDVKLFKDLDKFEADLPTNCESCEQIRKLQEHVNRIVDRFDRRCDDRCDSRCVCREQEGGEATA